MNRLSFNSVSRRKLLIGAVALLAVLAVFSIRFIAVSGNSMAPTVNDGDRVIVEKLSKYFDAPDRGDIIIVREPHEKKEVFVKRVIGLPSEKVVVLQNSVVIVHPDGREETFAGDVIGGRDNGDPHTRILGPEDYFVMGDNRQKSTDSRHWGTVQPHDIIGRPLNVSSGYVIADDGGKSAEVRGTSEEKASGLFVIVEGVWDFFKAIWDWFVGILSKVWDWIVSLIEWITGEAFGAYRVTGSLRFNDDDSAYLSRTPSGSGDRQKFTFSAWIKRGSNIGAGASGRLISARSDANNLIYLILNGDQLQVDQVIGGSYDGRKRVAAQLRDPSAWYHVVWASDTSNSIAGNRWRFYINGVEQTTFETLDTNPSTANTFMNHTVAHAIGAENAGSFFDGYMADVHFVDGQQLTASSFGEFDTTSGAWRPKSYSGSYGTNGFKLDFSDCSGITSSTLGNDAAGSNDWTPNNFSVTAGSGNDCLTDSPTNYGTGTSGGDVRGNFAVWNSIDKSALITLSNGNLDFAGNSNVDHGAKATMGFSSGKWYWENTLTAVSSSASLGICQAAYSASSTPLGSGSTCKSYYYDGNKYDANSNSSYGSSYTTGDIISVALDMDAGTVTFYKNGVSQGIAFSGLSGEYFPVVHDGGTASAATWSTNFGARPFNYTPPTDYQPLVTTYLPDPAIPKPKSYFDAITYSSPVLLVHADGTDAATTFIDSSQSSKALTANGNAQIDTAQSVFGGSSILLDGSGDYVSAADHANWTLGTSDFTVDFRVRFNSVADTQQGFVRQLANGGSTGWTIVWNGGDGLAFYEDAATAPVNYSSFSPSANTWYHIAVTRSGNTWRIFIDGTKVAEATSSASISDDGNTLQIGRGSTHGGATWNTGSEAYELNGWLDEFRIVKGAALYTTNFTPPTAAYVNGVNSAAFQPDFIWLKDRSSANSHALFDALRKAFPYLSADVPARETGSATALTAFNSDGFSLGSSSLFNTTGNSYISWNWKEGSTPGFDVVTYTGSGVARTISHSLGSAPEFMVVKRRDDGNGWSVYHPTVGATKYLELHDSSAPTTLSTVWNDTAPTSSVFSVGTHDTVNAAGAEYVAYLWNEVEGFSKFGSYTGNGSTDGPFVYTGFKPRWVMIKRSDGISDWMILDSARSTYNVISGDTLYADEPNAEDDASGLSMDFLTNGFKLRSSSTGNVSTATWIYAAFAESVFKGPDHSSGYQIARSLRFNDDDSAYLNRTPSSSSSLTTWTWSGWVKRANLTGAIQNIFAAGSNEDYLYFNASEQLTFTIRGTAAGGGELVTTQVFRDPGAWMHVVATYDSTNTTSSDRMRLYVNGSRVTALGTASYPSSGDQSYWNSNTSHQIGKFLHTNGYFDGYMADINFIDGQALDASYFGETDSTTGMWKPKAYSGSYGTNGFNLNFSDNSGVTSSTLGNDTSGVNNNDWTPNNFSVTAGSGNDSLTDTPTRYGSGTAGGDVRGNFGTWSPIAKGANVTLANGNLDVSYASVTTARLLGTFGMSSGKWYWEVAPTGSIGANSQFIGISSDQVAWHTSNELGTNEAYSYVYRNNGEKANNSSSSAYGSTYTSGDVISVAYDADNGKLFFAKNGTWQASGDPAAGTNAAFTGLSGMKLAAYSTNDTGGSITTNFGQRAFTYTPPTNFKPLTTQYLTDPTIQKPSNYFEAKTYTGGITAQEVPHSLGSAPEFALIKNRSGTADWMVYHASLGETKYLGLNSNGIATTTISAWNSTAPTSSVLTVATTTTTGAAGNSYIAYMFNEVEGFSKFGSFTGNGSTDGPFIYTGFKPRFLMFKRTDATSSWTIIDTARTTANTGDVHYIYPNLTNAEASGGDDAIDFLANGFKMRNTDGNWNTSGGTYIYAAFAESVFKGPDHNSGYQISRSLRFNSADSAYLSRTPSGAGTSRRIGTISFWLKRAEVATPQYIFSTKNNDASGSGTDSIMLGDGSVNETAMLRFFGSDTTSFELRTNALFRDYAKWHHVVAAWDTTQGTAANRIKLYVDGSEVTSFNTATYPSQNADLFIGHTVAHAIGRYANGGGAYLGSYLADMYYVDGQALTPSSFGETDSTTGMWKPKAYSGTYGTNGFNLNFSDNSGVTSSTLGNDTSGVNNNDWTPNNFSVTAGSGNDSLTDTPTNYGSGTSGGDIRGNFATMSPVDKNSSVTLSNGNLDAAVSAVGDNRIVRGTHAMTSGKWYFEATITNRADNGSVGVLTNAHTIANGNYIGSQSTGWSLFFDGSGYQKVNGSATSVSGTAAAVNDVIMVALDRDAGKIWFGKSGTWFESGNPATGANAAFSNVTSDVLPGYSGNGSAVAFNFGQRVFAHTPPSGFKPLVTTNIATSTIQKPSEYFDAKTYTGGNTETTVPHSLGSAPEFVLIKNRTSAANWMVYHASLGETKHLWLNSTGSATTTISAWVNTAPTSSVFTVATTTDVAATGNNYVAYAFNEVEGFSKFGTYTGNGSADGPFVYTGFKPRFVMIKRTDSADNWRILDSARSTYNPVSTEAFPNLSNAESAGNDIDLLSNGFKQRGTGGGNASSATYVYAAFAESVFKGPDHNAGFQIARSLRFNDDDTAYLNRTPGTAGNTRTWTWSGWIKRANLTEGNLFTSATDGTDYTTIYIRANDKLEFSGDNGTFQVITTQVFRDPNAWYHVVVAVDTTQSTAANRVRMYVNGSEVTSFSTATYPTLNYTTDINAAKVHRIGHMNAAGALYFDGYMTDLYFVDGEQLTPSSFGETDSTTGMWKPKAYSGIYGTNGFHIDFSDNSNTTAATLGADDSGNGNNYTPNNFSVTAGAGNDSLTDTPTNYGSGTAGGDIRGNFATWSSIISAVTSYTKGTLSNGSLQHNGTSNHFSVGSFAIPSTGKWYWETTIDTYGGTFDAHVGLKKANTITSLDSSDSRSYYLFDGRKYNGSLASYGAGAVAAGSVVGVAVDMDAGKVWFADDGTWQASGDPAAGTNAAFTDLAGSLWYPTTWNGSGTFQVTANFGQRAFAQTPPTGFKPLVTTNIATSTIQKPSEYFDAKTYTGSREQEVPHALGATPEFALIKNRSNAADWRMYHASLGETKFLELNTTDVAETNISAWVNTAPTSSNITVATTTNVNANGDSYVAYLWNEVEGFSKFGTYTGNGSTDGTVIYTGFKPRFVLIKRTDSAQDSVVWDTARDTYNPAITALIPNATSVDQDGAATKYSIDILSNGFKHRSTRAELNASGGTYVYAAFAESHFKGPDHSAGYQIARSLRFNDDDSAYLRRTFSAGNRKTFTWSGWVKRGNLSAGTAQILFSTGTDGNNTGDFAWRSDDKILFQDYQGGVQIADKRTTAVFRDPSAWYHVVLAVDTNQATAANRNRIYVNGTEITSFSTDGNYGSAVNTIYNQAATHSIGVINYTGSNYLDGYLADVHFVDGQQLTPSDFGEADSTTGMWKPKSYSGTYGTNGFKLNFSDNSNTTAATLGADSSGNGNNWTPNNFSVTAGDNNDSFTDTPTRYGSGTSGGDVRGNFCTMSPINANSNPPVFSEGNLKLTSTGTMGLGNLGTCAYNSGKWYFEVKVVATSLNGWRAEIYRADRPSARMYRAYSNHTGNIDNGTDTGIAYGNTFTTGDVISVAMDLDNGKVWFAKNGTWQNSGNPATGLYPAFNDLAGYYWSPAFDTNNGAGTEIGLFNFGQRAFAYTPPSGFKPMTTQYLTDPTVQKPSEYFDAKTYTGTGASQSVTGLGFQPNFTWIKNRSATSNHGLFDSVRGATKALYSNATAAEMTDTTSLTSFDSTGFTLGASTTVNNNGSSFISWNWKESVTAGFDVVTYTGNGGTTQNVTGLGFQPSFTWIKDRTSANNHALFDSVRGVFKYLSSNATTAEDTNTSSLTSFNSDGFTVKGAAAVNTAGNSYISWNWKESATSGVDVITYSGSGTTKQITGLGFEPNITWIKDRTSANNHLLFDSVRGAMKALFPNLSTKEDAAATTTLTSFTSTGFNLGASTTVNTNGNSYISWNWKESVTSGVDVVTYTGVGVRKNITGLNFQPDLVWIKDRTSANAHGLFDAQRSVYESLATDTGNPGNYYSTALSTITSTGFTLGASSTVNTSGNNYISWLWKESATPGFDIVTYTGTGIARTVSHSLGSTPEFMLIKNRTATAGGVVYHQSANASPQSGGLFINSTGAFSSDSTIWNSTAASSTEFTVGTASVNNTSGAEYVAYLWSEVEGFSKFGSYTGNGSADGPFVYTGFKPKFVLIRNTANNHNWWIGDTGRSTYNGSTDYLFGNSSQADTTTTSNVVDYLSNGFKIRNTTADNNTSGNTYIYAAFAEMPFKYSSSGAAADTSGIGLLFGMDF